MSRLSEIFKQHGKCFIPFLTAGYPDLESTRDIALRLAEAGAHIIEIGIPFSDPIADGPVIQRASFAALRHRHSISDYLDLVRDIRMQSDVGLLFMTYMNPVWNFGLERLEREASAAGLDGILISDLTPDEYSCLEPFRQLDTVFLAAPTSSDQRIARITAACSGFVYVLARTGVTGRHSTIDSALGETVGRVRRYTSLPIAVGFGIQQADDVRKVWEHADGAVVGTAIVRFIEEHHDEEGLPEQVAEYVRGQLLPV